MKIYNELGELINQLKNIFIYNNGKNIYNNQTQDKVNELLKQIASKSKTFDRNIKNEKRNIQNELTIIDTKTGKKVELIDSNNMADRVKNVLSKNNIFSCLKALALSNKCAHTFDGDLDGIKSNIEKYYNLIYSNQFDKKTFNFMSSIETIFPKPSKEIAYHYNLEDLEEKQFNKICNVLFCDNKNINKGIKISTLKSLNISFDIQNELEINEKFDKLRNDRENIVYSYLQQQYKNGQYILSLQSKMFAIKDEYISMIGQLLKNDKRFANIKYELVKTPDATKGFEYMLVIDDKDLQYYIEVHMPNFIANSLIKKYGLKESTQRETQNLGASAIYERDKEETNKVLDALNKGLIKSGEKRAKIMTRESTPSEETPRDYSFITEKIEEKPSYLETYLITNNIYLNDVEFNREIRKNERYPISFTKSIIQQNYYNIFSIFDLDTKSNFINYSLNELQNGDEFDKVVFQNIQENIYNYNYDIIGRLLINTNILKEDFVNKYSNMLNEILNRYNNYQDKIMSNFNNYQKEIMDKYNNYQKEIMDKYNNYQKEIISKQNEMLNDTQEKITSLINGHINEYIYDELTKESKKNGTKR